MTRTQGRFKKDGIEWYVNILLPEFNGHADDKKALRDAFKKEMREKNMGKALQFLQNVMEIKHDHR